MNDFAWLHHVGFGIMFLVLGVVLSAAGFLILRSSWVEITTWITVVGTVVGYDEQMIDKRSDRRASFKPQVKFSSLDGRLVYFTSSFGSNRRPYAIGAEVQVLYPSDDPQEAVIKSFASIFLVPIVIAALGFAFLGLALFQLFLE